MAFISVVAVVPNRHCGVSGDALVVAAAYDHGIWGVAADTLVLAVQLVNLLGAYAYASYPCYKSNIFQNILKTFKLLPKHSKLLKNIFLNFSVFLLTLVRVFYHFSVLRIVQRFVFCFRLEV